MYRTRVHLRQGGKPTRDDVARVANISGATVSRVLSGRSDISISPETRARVIEAAEKLGYRPNPMARALMNGRTGLVGFWMSLAYSRYRGQVLDRMRAVLGDTELALAVTDVDKEYTWDHSFDRALRVPVDGIVAFDNSASVEAFGREHDRIAPGVPFVSMGAYWSEAHSFVGIDLHAGALAAMDHLHETGRQRSAYVAPFNSGLSHEGVRFDAYCRRMSDTGLEPDVITTENGQIESLLEALAPRVRSNSLPEALLCMNDDLALAATYALERLGVRPGCDVALVGFDGIDEGAYGPCPITTVRQPVDLMCRLTYQFLLDRLNDPSGPPQQRILTPELVIRESTRT